MRAALGASDAGLSVLLIDKDRPGGGAVFCGCAALDTMLGAAEGAAQPSHSSIVQAQSCRAELLSQTMEHHLRTRQIEYLQASASLEDAGRDVIRFIAGGEEHEARRLLLATGSVAAVPEFEGVNKAIGEGVVHTERTLPSMKSFPETVLVAGGGLISLQLAAYANLCGANVTVVCAESRAAPELDPEIDGLLRTGLSADGIEFITDSEITSYLNGVFTLDTGREPARLKAGMLLCGGSRRPATRGLGLSSFGILAGSGAMTADSTGRTGLPGVYAAGDCAGWPFTLHGALSGADSCVRSITGAKHPPRRLLRVFSMRRAGNVFCVGDTLESARGKNIRAAEAKLPLPWTGRTTGMVKLVADAASRRLLGAHLIGDGAEEIAKELMPCVQAGASLESIRLALFTPSGEITGEALYRLQKTI